MSDPVPLESVRKLVAAFAPDASVSSAEPLGSGHIHATVRAVTEGAADLVLQQLNEYVFPDLDAVMSNIALVTEHLRARGAGARGTLELLRPSEPDTPGGWFVRAADGSAWRAFRFVAGSTSYDVAPDDEVARVAAEAFGRFAAQCSDLDPARLAIPLPGFHDLSARLAQLGVAAEADPVGRLAAVTSEREAILELGEAVRAALVDGGAEALPLRVLHNDCKLNNLLFDAESGEPLCVVDLDTVMPGWLPIDFGELVRTAACDAAEDEPDLSRVVYSPSRVAALASGYRAGLGGGFCEAELALLWLGPPWMAIENAARFLADHLSGDLYFRSGDNRARARAQLRLAEQFWADRAELKRGLDAG